MRTILLDVMLDGMFVCTMKYRLPWYEEVSEAKLREHVLSRLPTLKGKDFKIYPYDGKS